MRMKALGVALMVGFAAFTTFYWITDAPRRGSGTESRAEELLEFGPVVFLPDDSYTVEVILAEDGFAQEVGEELVFVSDIELFVNTAISFRNMTGATVTVAGTGTETFQLEIENEKTAPQEFEAEGQTTATADGVAGTLTITAGPPHLQPYGANCARCHGVDGMGGAGLIGPNLHSLQLAEKWAQTGGAQSLNNYVSWVITLGGVVRSGNIDSLMPAWGQDFGGTLTRQQIEALTAMIGEWAQETLDNPPPSPTEVPDTVEAGAEVYATAGCVGCHGADLQGGVGPNLQTIGSSLVTTFPPLITETLDIEQMQADYDADPRAFLEAWIRDSSVYNDGNPTAMPPFGDELSDSQLQALITFLLDHTE
jgi:mono/diheme cytochrome c family protein